MVWMLLACVLVLVVGGFAVDLWRAQATRSRLAAVADAAAAAGAQALDEAGLRDGALTLAPADADARTRRAVALHPDAHLVTGVTVDASEEVVQVAVSGTHEFTLLRLVGADRTDFTVTAAARPRRDG